MSTRPAGALGGCAVASLVAALVCGPVTFPAFAQVAYVLGDGETEIADHGGAYLGVRLVEETEHAEGGARVTHVVDGSPAQEAGLRVDDIVVEFGGRVIRGPVALTKQIHTRQPGETVTMKVVRDGRPQKLEVRLDERRGPSVVTAIAPESDRWVDWQDRFTERMENLGERLGQGSAYSFTVPEAGTVFSLAWGKPKLGVELVETTPELREHLGGNEDQGVLVSKVLDGTPAARAGIRVGDLILTVDGDAVASVGELRESLADKEGKTFAVRVARDGRPATIEVTIPERDSDRPTGPRARLLAPPPPPDGPRATLAPSAPLPAAPPAPPALPAPAAAPPPPPPAGLPGLPTSPPPPGPGLAPVPPLPPTPGGALV